MSENLLDGRYRLQERLGAGAFGVVHRAEHDVLGISLRSVAVKLFQNDPDGIPAAQRMLVEALRITRLVESCGDPWVRDRFVACHDAAAGETPYLVMELAAGDLGWQVAGTQLPATLVRDRLDEIAAGMAFLHDKQVLHLDLKPSNVVVAPSGGLKVADFGAATRVRDLVVGTPPRGTLVYQAPEVLEGVSPTPAADVYSIGLIGYELLTGHLPHQELLFSLVDDEGAPRTEALAELKRRPVPRPGIENPAVADHPVEQVVLRALDHMAHRRQRHAGELLAELRDTAAREPYRASDPDRQVQELIERLSHALARDPGDPATVAALEGELVAAHAELPDTTFVEQFYPVVVRAALSRDDRDTARRRAREGLSRRRCRATYRAMSEAFAGTDLGRGFGGTS